MGTLVVNPVSPPGFRSAPCWPSALSDQGPIAIGAHGLTAAVTSLAWRRRLATPDRLDRGCTVPPVRIQRTEGGGSQLGYPTHPIACRSAPEPLPPSTHEQRQPYTGPSCSRPSIRIQASAEPIRSIGLRHAAITFAAATLLPLQAGLLACPAGCRQAPPAFRRCKWGWVGSGLAAACPPAAAGS